jgi:membrane-bound ClpP family serine protease
MDFITEAEPILRTFWYIAIPTTVFFIIQTFMSVIGVGNHDFDHPDTGGHDTNGLGYFTLRNLVNFLLGFSWAGITFYNTLHYKPLLFGFAFFVGLVFLFTFVWMIRQILRFTEDNSFAIEQAIGQTAEVYLTIPAKGLGTGKIMVSVKGAYHELEAMSISERIETGSIVSIVGIEANMLQVAKYLEIS